MTDELSELESCEVAEPAASPAPATPPATWRILVVEDVPSQQKLLVKVLSKSGHSVATASCGRDAVDLVERETFDIVIMDVQMPGMTGLEAIRAIRTRETCTGAHVAIIAVTAHVLSGDAENCYEAGADAYLPKPINLADLLALVKLTAETHRRPGTESS